MRLSYTLIVTAAALLAITDSVSASTNAEENQLSKMATPNAVAWTGGSPTKQNSDITPRSLRRSSVEGDENDENDEIPLSDDEERAIVQSAKLKAWFALGKEPSYVYKKLRVSGVGEEVFNHKNWKVALEYWNMWHNSKAAKIAEQLKKSGQ